MRKVLTKGLATLALTVGLVFGIAQPASAHHTHSPSVICGEFDRARSYLTVYRVESRYNIYGHPVYAYCYWYRTDTFTYGCTRIHYATHNLSACLL